MRGVLVIIVLVFPIAEIWGIVECVRAFGWWLALWMVLAAIAGTAIIRQERARMGPRMKQMLEGGNTSLPNLLFTFRRLVGGILLVIPGVLSDIVAVLLLVLPARAESLAPGAGAGGGGPQIIDGEFRKVEPAVEHETNPASDSAGSKRSGK